MRPGALLSLAAAAALLQAAAAGPTGAQPRAPAEDAPEQAPALRQFLERAGVLRVLRAHPLGRLRLEEGASLRLEALSAHQPGREHRRALGIAVHLSPGGRAPEAGPLYVDLGEVAALLRAMGHIRRALEGEGAVAAEAPRSEYAFVTREGFGVVGVREGERRARRVLWKERAIGIGPDAFDALAEQLDEGRRALFAR